ncbi:hypothetical protein K7432_016342 [Basidiobolus ranarum]|uniref:Inhibitor I9 domain-containing protein n=1 Tax=Basidiobolus ranarum TaxID=34480 RepID=A0ABR2WEV7_9FUNG
MLNSLKLAHLFLFVTLFISSLVSARTCPHLKLELQDSNPAEFLNTQTYKSYIVFFKPETDLDIVREAEEDVECSGGLITHRYRAGVIGFSAQIPTDAVNTFSTSPHVQVVEEDQEVHTFDNKKQQMGF